MIITSPDQIRAARALLRLDQTEVARRARVSLATLRRVESSADKPHASVRAVASIQHALEAAGVEFIENGVRRRRSRSREEVEERVRRIMEIARQSAKFAAENPGGFSEDDLYDENGLPA
jgi:transcriptional regulator with XRE-family HTH domain